MDTSREGASNAPVFIVSTGRCGSTLLSAMVRRHPRILSVSEFFAYLGPGAVRAPRVSGEAAFRRLNAPTPALRAFLKHAAIGELLYPLGADGRYSADDLPPIMCTTLPHLTDEPEQLWDELSPSLRGRGRRRLTDHYRFVFEWLRRRFNRRMWIERTGGTLPMSPVLARHFPDARFVHIFRDGRDTAISMHNHPGFRGMAISSLMLKRIGLDPFSPLNWRGSSPWVHVVARIHMLLASPDRLIESDIPLESFGWVWSGMIERGTAFLNTLPAERVLSMRFESLLRSPREEAERFLDFLGPELADAAWLDEVSRLPRDLEPRWKRLSPERQARLAKACAPGQKILGYA